ELRKEQVDEHGVRPFAAGHLEPGHPVRRGQGLVPGATDDAARHIEVVRLVFDDQDPRHQSAPRTTAVARTWTGIVKLKTLPPAAPLSTQIRPPCSAMSRLLIASPRPVPP